MRGHNNIMPILTTPEAYSLATVNATLDDGVFTTAMMEAVGIQVGALTTAVAKAKLTADDLSRRWGISLEAATNTLQKTTQRGIRMVANPSISRRFRTNDQQLRYRRLAVTLVTDTFFSSVLSRRKNKCAQVFGDSEGWTRVHPMKSKSEAHYALSTLFQRDGVPIAIVMDGAREQTMGEFRKKAWESSCRIKATEPYSPWSNTAEGVIRELKKATMRKMLKSRSPKVLWDDCMELESMIRSHTACYSFGLQGETPEARVLGMTPDISPFVEFGWYQWVMFNNSQANYPDDKEVLGHYLGPSFDVGPAMTAKILKSNGQVATRTTLRPLTEEEQIDEGHQQLRQEYDINIERKLGDRIKQNYIPDDIDAPHCEAYDDDEEPNDTNGYAPDRDEVDVDAYDQYCTLMLKCCSQKGTE